MARYTDNEIRDITKILEAGKPLPEKYRFLLFEEKCEVELVWNGKTNEVCNVVLPFQTIEQVDEPRAEKDVKIQGDLFDPASGRQLKGWTNKLIWGDNKLILASLKNGPLREEIDRIVTRKACQCPLIEIDADIAQRQWLALHDRPTTEVRLDVGLVRRHHRDNGLTQAGGRLGSEVCAHSCR